MMVSLWSNCPGREMGSCNPLPEHQDQGGKRNKYKYKYKYREIECPGKELSSVHPETAHQKHVIKKEKKDEYKNRPPLRERDEFSAPLVNTDHQDCGKGGKEGNRSRNIVFFLRSFIITKVCNAYYV